jgi:hypothetical protein
MEYDIQKACRLANIEEIRRAVEINPSAANEIDAKLGWSPLYRSVICGHVEVVQVLIELNADPN